MCINRGASDEVTEKLRDAIISGEYLPSERLIEDSLALRFQTSRTPVREAIRNLASSGLIKLVPNKGAIVVDIDTDEIRDIYIIRVSLEALACKLATPNIPDDTIIRLDDMIEEMDRSIEDGDRRTFEKWNMDFHLTIYKYCGNKILFNMIKDLLDKSVLFRRASWESYRNLKSVMKTHKEMLAAIKERDAEKAQKITENHTRLFITESLPNYN